MAWHVGTFWQGTDLLADVRAERFGTEAEAELACMRAAKGLAADNAALRSRYAADLRDFVLDIEEPPRDREPVLVQYEYTYRPVQCPGRLCTACAQA